MRRQAPIRALGVGLVWVAGCATMGDVVKAKSEGTSQIYPVTGDQAWDMTKTVFRWEGSDAIEEHRPAGYMLTSSGMHVVSYGAGMGAGIEPIDWSQTQVTVVTKRRLAMNVATTLTETTFHQRFAQAVALGKAGQPFPVVAPQLGGVQSVPERVRCLKEIAHSLEVVGGRSGWLWTRGGSEEARLWAREGRCNGEGMRSGSPCLSQF